MYITTYHIIAIFHRLNGNLKLRNEFVIASFFSKIIFSKRFVSFKLTFLQRGKNEILVKREGKSGCASVWRKSSLEEAASVGRKL